MPQIVKEEIEKWFKETYPKGDLYENIYLDKNESGARLKKKIFALALCMVLTMMPSMGFAATPVSPEQLGQSDWNQKG